MTSTRVAAGLIGLAILLPAVILGGPWAVVIIVALTMAVGLAEYAAMAFPTDRHAAFVWLALGAYGLAAASLWGGSDVLVAAGAVIVVTTFTFVTFRPGEHLAGAADRVGRYVLGMVWIGGLLPFLVRLRELPDGIVWLVLSLAISWLGDTGAYFAGRRFGRHKLYPLVSPKKTWEGFVGGIALAVVGVFVFRAVWLPTLDLLDVIVLGAAGCSAGVVGDLAESLLKRSFDVKDSGWILPGHGGILDRIDSLLFVAPLVWTWAMMRGVA